ncbi:MAG TPA: hypothetical protein VN901_29385 [Candidatus Acidoferrales bacterium]|nr:hypothetical protein [Candidatus Acidoferrales bacterium]
MRISECQVFVDEGDRHAAFADAAGNALVEIIRSKLISVRQITSVELNLDMTRHSSYGVPI